MLSSYPNAHLPRIYPWDEYDQVMIINWLYLQARKTGYLGSLEDFKLRYGEYANVQAYPGPYTVVPLSSVDQILSTKNTILEDNIVIEKIPYAETSNEAGGYTVIIG